MQRVAFITILFSLTISGLTGCSGILDGTVNRPSLAPDSVIQTIRAYQEAVYAANDQTEMQMKEFRGNARLLACAKELAKLPSKESREFSRLVLSMLHADGLGDDVPLPAEGGSVMTYDELARLESLTTWLLGAGGAREGSNKSQSKVPFRVQMHLFTLTAKWSPSDGASLVGAMQFTNQLPDDVELPDVHDASLQRELSRDYREACVAVLQRAQSHDRLNLSVLSLRENPAIWGFVLYYAKSSSALSTQAQMRDVIRALRETAREGEKIDRSEGGRATLQAFERDAENLMTMPDLKW